MDTTHTPENPVADTEDQQLREKDEAYRAQKQEQAAQDPQAKQWVELDRQAGELSGQIAEGKTTLTWVRELEATLQAARDERDAWREANPRPDSFGHQKDWDEHYTAMDQRVGELQEDFKGALKEATPSDLHDLRSDLDKRIEAQQAVVAQRQELGMLPSEEHQQTQKANEQFMDDFLTRNDARDYLERQLEQRRSGAGREQDDGQEQEAVPAQDSGQDFLAEQLSRRRDAQEQEQETGKRRERVDEIGASESHLSGDHARMGRANYAAYAESADERAAYRQLEEDQQHLASELGRRATHEEVVAYQAQRQNSQEHQQEQGQQQNGADLHAQVAQGEGSLAARRAQRQEQGNGRVSTYGERQAADKVQAAQQQAAPKQEQAQVRQRTREHDHEQTM